MAMMPNINSNSEGNVMIFKIFKLKTFMNIATISVGIICLLSIWGIPEIGRAGKLSHHEDVSHVTHLTSVRGPRLQDNCAACHTGCNPSKRNVDYDLCISCHSPDGAYDGINDPIIGAKNNWQEGVYTDNILKSGKEKWCVGCHDDAPANSKADGTGIYAPNIAGDNNNYGFYVNGHKSRLCSECHDLEVEHIDGEARTYTFHSADYEPNQSGVTYASGYRLRYIDGEVPLMIPANYNITFGYNAQTIKETAFRLCFTCHQGSEIFDNTPGDGIDNNFKASLPNPPRNYSYAWGSGADINEHVSHILNYIGPFADSDWDFNTNGAGGINGSDSLMTCSSCHNVHGVAGTHGSTNESMIRDGSLSGRDGYSFSYVIEDTAVGGYPMVTSTGATQATSVGAVFRNNTSNMCAGFMCHGNPDPPSASSYNANGSSWGSYLEYYRAPSVGE